jgi:hypothetical protein
MDIKKEKKNVSAEWVLSISKLLQVIRTDVLQRKINFMHVLFI